MDTDEIQSETWEAVGDVDLCEDPFAAACELLGAPELAQELNKAIAPLGESGDTFASAFLLLVDQALTAPDYRTLGKGWFYPCSRLDYRERLHGVFNSDVAGLRHKASKAHLLGVAEGIVTVASTLRGTLRTVLPSLLCSALLSELGFNPAKGDGWEPSLEGMLLALKAELVYPLRAIVECDLTSTSGGQAIPSALVDAAVSELVQSLVEGRYREWKYGCETGARQLLGLTPEQTACWKETARILHAMETFDISTYDDDDVEVFWASKIGGPSHGFDYEGQCVLPLVCNARQKVIFVEDQLWPYHPVAQGHLRLLHRVHDKGPVLHLEAVQEEFRFGQDEEAACIVDAVEARFAHDTDDGSAAAADPRFNWGGDRKPGLSQLSGKYVEAVVRHAVAKAEAMNLPLSLATYLEGEPIIGVFLRSRGVIERVREPLVLVASNGVVEASDSLTFKHDWVQTVDQMTAPTLRILFVPRQLVMSGHDVLGGGMGRGGAVGFAVGLAM